MFADFAKRFVERPGYNQWHFRIKSNSVELRHGLVAQARFRPNVIPKLPHDVLAVIDKKAAQRFHVYHIVSPYLLHSTCYETFMYALESFGQDPESEPFSLDDALAFAQRLNLMRETKWNAPQVQEDGEVWADPPPQAVMDFLNDPANGDGTSEELGNAKELLLVS